MGHYIFCDKYNCDKYNFSVTDITTQRNKSYFENLSIYVPEMILNSIYDKNKLEASDKTRSEGWGGRCEARIKELLTWQ